MSEEPRQRSGFMRLCLLSAGWLSLALGFCGIFLPILPTTPFLILSAACFVRSSPSAYRLLVENRRFGPILEQWRRERSVPSWAKRRAYLLVLLSLGISILACEGWFARGLLVSLLVGLLLFLRRLKTGAPVPPPLLKKEVPALRDNGRAAGS